MRIVCIGGGPAGLYFALLMKKLDPAHRITVVERNRPYDTFGWGVVFSDATMENMRLWDAATADAIEVAFNHWDDIELHFKGRCIRSGGHGFVGIGRKKLLNILQRRCEALGVELVFETEAESDADYPDADLVIASDGINSRIRQKYAEVFHPDIVARPNRFIWLGTTRLFDAFNFLFEKTEHGWFQAHVYKFDQDTSTFIVECPEHVWTAHGLHQADQQQSIDFCERLFAANLQGARLMTNARHLRGSAWLNFNRVLCRKWHHNNIVLIGDAAHTAHFSIGSGTKLAMEDAIALAKTLAAEPGNVEHALALYQTEREIEALKLQSSARNRMEWFENVARYAHLEPEQYAYTLLTGSQRIGHENLRLRDQAYVDSVETWFAQQAGLPAKPLPPMFTPFRLRGLTLKNRVVVSPMAMYSCQDGLPADFLLVHLGSRALGGAGLVMTEMTCISPEARARANLSLCPAILSSVLCLPMSSAEMTIPFPSLNAEVWTPPVSR